MGSESGVFRCFCGMTQKLIQFPAIVLQYPYRFAMGAIGCKMGAAGCKSGSVGATSSFHFAICCFAHVCPVSGFRTERGVSSTEVLKPERAANRGLCGQLYCLTQDAPHCFLKPILRFDTALDANVDLLYYVTQQLPTVFPFRVPTLLYVHSTDQFRR